MTNFIKVSGVVETCDFLDLDKVTRVSCAIRRTKTGGGFNLKSIADATLPKSVPVDETITPVITLCTAGGNAEIRFINVMEATRWAKDNLGIDVPFDQL